jgi:hypothetical protein
MASSVFALNDKKYLPSIVQKIIVEAKKTKAEEQSRQGAGEQNENSHTSEQQQQSPKAEKKGASAYRTAMLVALGGVALAVVGAVELSRTWSLHEKLLTAQTEALKKLPIKYRGGNITLVDMQVGYLGITYVNTVADEGRAQFDSQLTVLKSDVRKGICASEDMKAMLNSGASYSYEYRDQIGNVIFGFAVDSCP